MPKQLEKKNGKMNSYLIYLPRKKKKKKEKNECKCKEQTAIKKNREKKCTRTTAREEEEESLNDFQIWNFIQGNNENEHCSTRKQNRHTNEFCTKQQEFVQTKSLFVSSISIMSYRIRLEEEDDDD